MVIVRSQQKQKIHPQIFILWVAIASIIMMFAGLTSAYIVKSNQAGWQNLVLPQVFYISTILIVGSSATMQFAVSSFKKKATAKFKQLLGITVLLGILFVILQCVGFQQLWESGIQLKGVAGAGQFLYVIFGLHGLHVVGGVVALIVMAIKAIFNETKIATNTPIEVMATYWHFVDFLWVYILLFFIWIQ